MKHPEPIYPDPLDPTERQPYQQPILEALGSWQIAVGQTTSCNPLCDLGEGP
jgi:hypothetical protein